MGIMDRDYMRRRQPASSGSALSRWWQRSSIADILGVVVIAITLLSSAVWLVRDLHLFGGSREATLRVNVNTATLDELETLPGIGPAMAGLIVADRPYTSVDDLVRVKGIGPATVQGLRPYVKTTGETEEVRLK